MLAVAVLLALVSGAASAAAKTEPPMPYVEWGACPFEGCAYGQWRAVRRTALLAARRADAPVAFHVPAGQCIAALTGVVITTRPGRIKVAAAVTLGEGSKTVSLRPGDIIYPLRYVGEAYELFWFNGSIFKDQINTRGLGPIQTNLPVDPLEALELPTTEWWVKVRAKTGKVGWSAHPEDFENNGC